MVSGGCGGDSVGNVLPVGIAVGTTLRVSRGAEMGVGGCHFFLK